MCTLTSSCNIIYGNDLFILLYGSSSGCSSKYSYWDISLRTNSSIYIGENKVATVDQIPDDIVFNTAYSASTNKAATMADVPTTLASLTEDDTHKTVTATEKSTWTAKADLASPSFTGVPVAPTAAAGTNTTQIATTAFVNAAVDAAINDALNASY